MAQNFPNNSSEKEMALQHIDTIHAIINNNLRINVPANRMFAVGIAVSTIPCIEYILTTTLDPLLTLPTYGAFFLRTVLYWSLFASLSKLFPAPSKPTVLKKLFVGMKFFPLIPVSMAALLAYTGHADLIGPLILILIGSVFSFFGMLAQPVILFLAWALIIGGLVGIYCTSLAINNLWHYLLFYQGALFIITGLILRCTNNSYQEEKEEEKIQE